MRYLSSWSEEILMPIAERVGIIPIISKGKNATRSHVSSNIKSKNPKFIFFNGHGTSASIMGQYPERETLINLGENDELLKDKIVHALTCNAGHELGIKCPAKAFIGYKSYFWLCMDRFSLNRPLEDKFASPVLLAAMEAPSQLLKGKTPKDAFEMANQSYQKWIDKYTHSESKYTTEGLELILPILHINRSCLVLHEAKP
jgi:hypothetical protein